MSDTVLVALIALMGTLLGSYMGVLQSNKLVAHRIAQLEKKQDKHNNLIERVFHLESDHDVMEARLNILEGVSKKEKRGGD